MTSLTVEFIIGAVAGLYGIVTLFFGIISPSKLKKLAAMKKVYGEKPGLIIYVILYVVIPFVIGFIFLESWFRGKSLF